MTLNSTKDWIRFRITDSFVLKINKLKVKEKLKTNESELLTHLYWHYIDFQSNARNWRVRVRLKKNLPIKECEMNTYYLKRLQNQRDYRIKPITWPNPGDFLQIVYFKHLLHWQMHFTTLNHTSTHMKTHPTSSASLKHLAVAVTTTGPEHRWHNCSPSYKYTNLKQEWLLAF